MQDNKAIMQQLLALWSTRDWDAMANRFSKDAIYDNVPEKKPMHGQEAIREWLKAVFSHLSRIDVKVLHMVCEGEWILTERLDDHIIGDKHMPLPVMNASRIVDGKIVLYRDYYDRKTVAELGMI